MLNFGLSSMSFRIESSSASATPVSSLLTSDKGLITSQVLKDPEISQTRLFATHSGVHNILEGHHLICSSPQIQKGLETGRIHEGIGCT